MYTATFSEPMSASNLDASDFVLHGTGQNADYQPTSFSFDASATVLTISYSGLPADQFTLTLVSAGAAFEDLAGNDLDGEPVAFPIPPNQTGDGVEGGNFLVSFTAA
jgi:hypothetical protein